MNTLLVGQYVKYQGRNYLLVSQDYPANGMGHILRPAKAGGIDKRHVKLSNLVVNEEFHPAALVDYKERNYLVTGRGRIVSCSTGKFMKWGDSDGNRKAILKVAKDRFAARGVVPLFA